MSDSNASPPLQSGRPPLPYLVLPGPGRLLLLRVFHLDDVVQVVQFFLDIRVAHRALGDWVVVCADYRPVLIFKPEVAEEIARRIGETNSRVQRSAVLSARSHATQSLQSSRLVKTAGLSERRQFTDVYALTEFLDEVLTPPERARLRDFLAEYPGPDGSNKAP